MSIPTNGSPAALQTGSSSGYDPHAPEILTQRVYPAEVIRTFGPPWFQILRNAHLDNWLIRIDSDDDADDKKIEYSLPSHTSTSFGSQSLDHPFLSTRKERKADWSQQTNKSKPVSRTSSGVVRNCGQLLMKTSLLLTLEIVGFKDARILDMRIKKSLKSWEMFCYRFLFSSWIMSNTNGLVSTIIGICKFNAMIAAGFPKEKPWNWIWWIFVTAPCLLVPFVMMLLKVDW
jgi:hypothetical protein